MHQQETMDSYAIPGLPPSTRAASATFDEDEEFRSVMVGASKWNPQPVVSPPVREPIEKTYLRQKLYEQLHEATKGFTVNIFKCGEGAKKAKNDMRQDGAVNNADPQPIEESTSHQPSTSHTPATTGIATTSPQYRRRLQMVRQHFPVATPCSLWKLPLELRHQIWNHLMDSETTIRVEQIKVPFDLTRFPGLLERCLTNFTHIALHICSESREIALKRLVRFNYQKCFGDHVRMLYSKNQFIWWNPSSILLFESFPQHKAFVFGKNTHMNDGVSFKETKITCLAFKCLPAKTSNDASGNVATKPLFIESQWVAEQLLEYKNLQRLIFIKSSMASIGRSNLYRGSSKYVTLDPEGSQEDFENILKGKMRKDIPVSSWWKNPKVEIVTEEEFMKNG